MSLTKMRLAALNIAVFVILGIFIFYVVFNVKDSLIQVFIQPFNELNADNKSLLYSLADISTENAEINYWWQRNHELATSIHPFMSYASNWPCFWGETFAVSNKSYNFENNIINDGGKWVCGATYLTNPCIIYSIGSNNNWIFEYGLTELLNPQQKCQIFTFDPFDGPKKNELQNLLPNIKFYPWGMADKNNNKTKMYRLSKIMELLNHTHIDILKIDIEGQEFPALYSLDSLNEWPSIGQILIEIHPHYRKIFLRSFGKNYKNQSISKTEILGAMVNLLEKHNFRIYHREPNPYWVKHLCEYAFIQKDYRPHIKHYE